MLTLGKNTVVTNKISTVIIEKIIEQQQSVWKEKGIKYNFTLESNEWFTV